MPLPEGADIREMGPILETVSDILALEIQKTMDFYRATVEDGESAVAEDSCFRRWFKIDRPDRVSRQAV